MDPRTLAKLQALQELRNGKRQGPELSQGHDVPLGARDPMDSAFGKQDQGAMPSVGLEDLAMWVTPTWKGKSIIPDILRPGQPQKAAVAEAKAVARPGIAAAQEAAPALDMSKEARMARAKDLGFGEKTFFTGTQRPVKQFSPETPFVTEPGSAYDLSVLDKTGQTDDYISALVNKKMGPLENLPASSPGPTDEIKQAANRYIKDSGLPTIPKTQYAQVDPKRGERIAEAFTKMKHDPEGPEVSAAYEALVKETEAQYKMLKDMGIKVDFIKPGMENPYPKGSADVINDIRNNKHLYVFPTESGFGSSTFDNSKNPLLKVTNETISGQPAKANDLFRAVHDVFGHVQDGVGFGARGEENAFLSHGRMFSEQAKKALASETRGQNSWVNFGPHGAANRTNPAATTYADQKAGILPKWAIEEAGTPSTAPLGQNISQVRLRMQNPMVVEADASVELPKVLEAAKAAGNDSVVIRNAVNPADPDGLRKDIVYMLDNSGIRSVNAAFDPAKKNSRDILAGITAAGGIAAGSQEAKAAQEQEAKMKALADLINQQEVPQLEEEPRVKKFIQDGLKKKTAPKFNMGAQDGGRRG